jgi:hypothetical protein
MVSQTLQFLNVLQPRSICTGNSYGAIQALPVFHQSTGPCYEIGNSARRIAHVNLSELSDSYMNNS